MKKVLLIGCVGVPVLLVLILVIGYFSMSSEYDVQSQIVVDAPVDQIYPLVNTLPRWPEWTVWTKDKYPNMETNYTGPESGVGARSSWSDESGDGWMEITRSDPQTGIDFKLQFAEFPESQGRVHLKTVDGGTEVTMGLKGDMPGMFKLMLPLMKPAMVDEYRQNLEKLKGVVEGQ